ncbi:hypothetical protein XENOCAPTIV_025481 [Xenoophorus captivus]|uniref:Uncharacterized protein n=1 Tax=Xenoophorus captivus TaxID=1517983 RepID=A0ABV0S0D4_9TELE
MNLQSVFKSRLCILKGCYTSKLANQSRRMCPNRSLRNYKHLGFSKNSDDLQVIFRGLEETMKWFFLTEYFLSGCCSIEELLNCLLKQRKTSRCMKQNMFLVI